MAGKVGRPKRAEDVTPVLLRIPTELLARVHQCKATIELQEGVNLSRTEAFWRILQAGCTALTSNEPAPGSAHTGKRKPVASTPHRG
jgi:hypothetical protein